MTQLAVTFMTCQSTKKYIYYAHEDKGHSLIMWREHDKRMETKLAFDEEGS